MAGTTPGPSPAMTWRSIASTPTSRR
jgi:hypothetical protein